MWRSKGLSETLKWKGQRFGKVKVREHWDVDIYIYIIIYQQSRACLIQAFINSFIRSFMHSFICSFIHTYRGRERERERELSKQL